MNDLLQNVLNYVEQQEDVEFKNSTDLSTDEKRKTFSIETDEQADRVLAWYRQRQVSIINNTEAANAARERLNSHVDKWEHDMNTSLIASCNFFQSLLETFANKKLEGKKGKVKLLNGTLKLAQPKPKIEYDELKTIQWLKDNGLANYVKDGEPILDKVELKKACITSVDKTRLVISDKEVDGITLIPQNMSFSFDIAELKALKKNSVSKKAVKDIVNPSTEMPAA